MDDQQLLQRYLESADTMAFDELTQRYTGMVQTVCYRLIGNRHDAEEVAQECFLELARHAAEVHTSVAGWLHRTATSRSLNWIRSQIRRKVREQRYSDRIDAEKSPDNSALPELRELLQSGIEELPAELRAPVVLHYVDGRSQRDVALKLGVNQSTICRRMQEGLRQLREKLSHAGFAATIPALTALMQEQAAGGDSHFTFREPTIETFRDGVAGSVAAAFAKSGTMVLLTIAGYLVFDGWLALALGIGGIIAVVCLRPAWVPVLWGYQNPNDLYGSATYFFSRWRGNVSPDVSLPQVGTSLASGFVLTAMALLFAFATHRPAWGTVVLGALMGTGYLVYAVRLGILFIRSRLTAAAVSSLNSHPTFTSETPAEKTPIFPQPDDSGFTWIDVLQRLVMGVAGALVLFSGLQSPHIPPIWPVIVMVGCISLWMFGTGLSASYHGLLKQKIAKIEEKPRSGFNQADSHIGWMIAGLSICLIATLSYRIALNPDHISRVSISLAALQTCMLGWVVYRYVRNSHFLRTRCLRQLAFFILAACFLLNSAVCVANWPIVEAGR